MINIVLVCSLLPFVMLATGRPYAYRSLEGSYGGWLFMTALGIAANLFYLNFAWSDAIQVIWTCEFPDLFSVAWPALLSIGIFDLLLGWLIADFFTYESIVRKMTYKWIGTSLLLYTGFVFLMILI